MTFTTQRKVIDFRQSMLFSSANSMAAFQPAAARFSQDTTDSSLNKVSYDTLPSDNRIVASEQQRQQQSFLHRVLLWTFVLGTKCIINQPWNSPLVATLCYHMDWILFCLLSVSIIIRTLRVSKRLFVIVVLFHFVLNMFMWSLCRSSPSTINGNHHNVDFAWPETGGCGNRWCYNTANYTIYIYILLWLHRPFTKALLNKDYYDNRFNQFDQDDTAEYTQFGGTHKWWQTSLSGLIAIMVHQWIDQTCYSYYYRSRSTLGDIHSVTNIMLSNSIEQWLCIHVITHGIYLLLSKNMAIIIRLRHQRLIQQGENKRLRRQLSNSFIFSTFNAENGQLEQDTLATTFGSSSPCVLLKKESNHNGKSIVSHHTGTGTKRQSATAASITVSGESKPWITSNFSVQNGSRDHLKSNNTMLLTTNSVTTTHSMMPFQPRLSDNFAESVDNLRLSSTSPFVLQRPIHARVEVLDSFDLCVVGLSAYTATFTWIFPLSLLEILDAKPWHQNDATNEEEKTKLKYNGNDSTSCAHRTLMVVARDLTIRIDDVLWTETDLDPSYRALTVYGLRPMTEYRVTMSLAGYRSSPIRICTDPRPQGNLTN
jgi:hypothetical protein